MNSATEFGLSTDTLNKIRSVFSKHPKIESVIVYGSRAKGNYQEGSDIDLTVNAFSYLTGDLLRLENELEELMLPYKIDLSLLHQIENPNLVEHIERVGKLFFAQGSLRQ